MNSTVRESETYEEIAARELSISAWLEMVRAHQDAKRNNPDLVYEDFKVDYLRKHDILQSKEQDVLEQQEQDQLEQDDNAEEETAPEQGSTSTEKRIELDDANPLKPLDDFLYETNVESNKKAEKICSLKDVNVGYCPDKPSNQDEEMDFATLVSHMQRDQLRQRKEAFKDASFFNRRGKNVFNRFDSDEMEYMTSNHFPTSCGDDALATGDDDLLERQLVERYTNDILEAAAEDETWW